MATFDLADVFNDCVDRLNAGQSIEDCLRAYPGDAERLRPLLETVALVHGARPAVPLGARARVRERVLRSAPGARRRWLVAPPGLTLAAASVLVVGFAIALLLLAKRDLDPNVRVEPLRTYTATSTLTAASPTPTLFLTPTERPSLTPTAPATETVSPSATVTLTPSPTRTARPSAIATRTPTPSPICLFRVSAASVNLRSGPGTGYGIVGSAGSGEVFAVLAANTSRDWLEIQADARPVWISASPGTLSGECETLPLATAQPGSGAGAPADTVAPDTDDDSGDDTHHDDDADSDADDASDDGDEHPD